MMAVEQTVPMTEVKDFYEAVSVLFSGHTNGLARFGDDVVLKVKFKRSYIEFRGGSEVFFFNVGRSALGKDSKQRRSPNYFYISDDSKQLAVRVNGSTATLSLTTHVRAVRNTG